MELTAIGSAWSVSFAEDVMGREELVPFSSVSFIFRLCDGPAAAEQKRKT